MRISRETSLQAWRLISQMRRSDGKRILTADRMDCFEWFCRNVAKYGSMGVSRPDVEHDWQVSGVRQISKARRLHDFEELGLAVCIGTKPSRAPNGDPATSATARAFIPKSPADLPDAAALQLSEKILRARELSKQKFQAKVRAEVASAVAGDKLLSVDALTRMCAEIETYILPTLVNLPEDIAPLVKLKSDILRRLNIAVRRGRSRTPRPVNTPRSKWDADSDTSSSDD